MARVHLHLHLHRYRTRVTPSVRQCSCGKYKCLAIWFSPGSGFAIRGGTLAINGHVPACQFCRKRH